MIFQGKNEQSIAYGKGIHNGFLKRHEFNLGMPDINIF